MSFSAGGRVRLRETSQTGTVIERIAGNVVDAVHVEWDSPRLDSRWNRHHRSWEPSTHLEGIQK